MSLLRLVDLRGGRGDGRGLLRPVRGDEPAVASGAADVFAEVRPSAHTRKLEYMDLVAVRECTDARFLPPHFREMTPEQVEGRINELRPFV